nr:hypothetical protein [Corynebacterium stercoris]
MAIAACSPPHQIDSDQKIDTATSQNPDSLASSGKTGATAAASATNVAEASAVRASNTASATATAQQAADGTPLLNNCGDLGLERPTSLNLDCKGGKERLEDIVWDSWDANGAKGTATRITVNPDRVVEGAQVTLGSPQEVDGKLVFTVISVDGNSINPESNY